MPQNQSVSVLNPPKNDADATGVALIMAQLGCRVNAEKCRVSPVQRIFTRIGAYDAVLEGKSTLLTELEALVALDSALFDVRRRRRS